MTDVIIIGNGPAGVSAALYTKRAGIDTLIIGRDNGSLGKADKVENYYGFALPVSGTELINNGIAAVKRLGVDIISDEVLDIQYFENFSIKTKKTELQAHSVIIATGISRNTPRIKGIAEFEGKGISYCAVCDGFFYRGKDVCVIGEGSYAVHEAKELLPLANSVTLATNGVEPNVKIPDEIKVQTKKILEIQGTSSVDAILFENDELLRCSGIFIAIGVAGSTDFAKKLGAQTEGNKIIVDENMATNVPGLFAAGDCTAGMLQVAKAVYDGAKAGTEAVKYIRQLKKGV
ncbi:MAG: NAD(P)/FAD-dependent oxidoreductase [Clostridiaceae bacterium]|nr:NAD(P)/FAD-dependent oxidoreductase [Clostridiaceae bacterium]